MNILQFARYYEPEIPEEVVDSLMWNETCYPFGTFRKWTEQLRSAIRAKGIQRCELCGWKKPYHKHYCPLKKTASVAPIG